MLKRRVVSLIAGLTLLMAVAGSAGMAYEALDMTTPDAVAGTYGNCGSSGGDC